MAGRSMKTAGDSARVANHAIAGLLLLARAFPQRLIAQREHRWLQLRREQAPADLEGQTVLIIGVGAVGSAVARFAQALGMQVIGVRRAPQRAGDPVDEMHGPARLPELLPRADWVLPACPYDAATHHLLDARNLGAMRRGAGIINVADAGLTDTAALYAALQSGQIGSAYLADFATNPLAADAPLRTHPNVIVAPVVD